MVRNLKPDRNFHPNSSDISFFANVPAMDGRIVCVYGWPTGGNLDDPNAEVGPPTGTLANTIPAGLLMQEVVDYDVTRYSKAPGDFEEILVGSKVAVYTKGWCVTRCIAAGADTSLAGKAAYYDAVGNFTTASGSPRVGTFQSERDVDGYVRVYIDVPHWGKG